MWRLNASQFINSSPNGSSFLSRQHSFLPRQDEPWGPIPDPLALTYL
jgi:hypothetical protein